MLEVRKHNFRFYEVNEEADLDTLLVEPPAIAYVRVVGDFFFRHSPRYWLGEPGDASKWIRIGLSGGLSQILATNYSYLSGVAQTLLGRLVSDGRDKFNSSLYSKYVQGGGGFYGVAAELFMQARDYQLTEMNDRACGPEEGDYVHNLHDGDIILERGQAYCVQEKTLAPETPLLKYRRTVKHIGMQPLCERPVNGLVRQHANLGYRNFTDTHKLPIGFVVCESAIPVGATSFNAAIYPNSVPTPSKGGGKRWRYLTQGQYDGIPDPKVVAPGGTYDVDRPWDTREFAWIQSPHQTLEVDVVSFSGVSGGTMPECLNSTLTLAQPCPMPLLFGGVVVEKSTNTYFVAPPSRSFGFLPIVAYGGELGKTSFSIRPRPHANERILGQNGQEYIANKGSVNLDLFRSWQGTAGQRRFSRFRGMEKDDFVSISNYNNVYKVREVFKNNLENPSSLRLDQGLFVDVGHAVVNNNGYSLATARAWWVPGKITSPMKMQSLGWGSPDGKTGVPLIIKRINFGQVELMAPNAQEIPAGTRMPVWLSTDLDSNCYAYHDFYRFMHDLEQYITVREDITIEGIREKITEIVELRRALSQAQDRVGTFAREQWYRPPYFRNTLYDNYLPDDYTQYGSTFVEVFAALDKITSDLAKLAGTSFPSWNVVEYISLIQYNHYMEIS